MRKALFTLAVLTMAFGNVSFAQQRVTLKSNATQNVFKHYGIRDEITTVPQTADWRTVDGDFYRINYTYDEYDYYLIEEVMSEMDDDNWVDVVMINYEYDFSGNVIEALSQTAYEGYWENESRAVYTYENFELSEVVYQEWENGNWVNETKEVYTYNDDVTTVLYWDWNGSNWSSDELYTYTYGNGTIELLIQYMQGGAWQNDEKVTYTLDFDEHVTEIVYELWQNNAWLNSARVLYDYNNEGCYETQTLQGWYASNSSWGDAQIIKYDYENGNAVHGECTDDYGVADDADLEMAYGYNSAFKTFYGWKADMTYVDLTGVDEKEQANFVVYPLPAHDEITIQAKGFQKAEVYSLAGQKLMESQNEKMNVGSLSQGVYLLKVYDLNGNSEAQRIIVK